MEDTIARPALSLGPRPLVGRLPIKFGMRALEKLYQSTPSADKNGGSAKDKDHLIMPTRVEKFLTIDNHEMYAPTVSSDSIRGVLRRLLASHLAEQLDLTWLEFFSMFFSSTTSAHQFAISTIEDGGRRPQGVEIDATQLEMQAAVRAYLPYLSLFGFFTPAMSLTGKLAVNRVWPVTRETLHLVAWEGPPLPEGVEAPSLAGLLRDALHSTTKRATRGVSQRIIRGNGDAARVVDQFGPQPVTYEYIPAGTLLTGLVRPSVSLTDVEASCLATGLRLWALDGRIGGRVNSGFGTVGILTEPSLETLPDSALYEQWIADHRDAILTYLSGPFLTDVHKVTLKKDRQNRVAQHAEEGTETPDDPDGDANADTSGDAPTASRTPSRPRGPRVSAAKRARS